MKLTELDAQFMQTTGERTMRPVETLAEAQGLMFLCPHCYKANGGRAGTHSIIIWFAGRGAPPSWNPPDRWEVSGTSLADLTIKPSILNHGCWHGFVTNGDAA